MRSLSLRSGNSPTTPYGGRVNGLQILGFPPPCHPNYRALALTPAGLSPAERASLCWTHVSRADGRVRSLVSGWPPPPQTQHAVFPHCVKGYAAYRVGSAFAAATGHRTRCHRQFEQASSYSTCQPNPWRFLARIICVSSSPPSCEHDQNTGSNAQSRSHAQDRVDVLHHPLRSSVGISLSFRNSALRVICGLYWGQQTAHAPKLEPQESETIALRQVHRPALVLVHCYL